MSEIKYPVLLADPLRKRWIPVNSAIWFMMQALNEKGIHEAFRIFIDFMKHYFDIEGINDQAKIRQIKILEFH